MRLTVLLFAGLRESFGADSLELALEDDCSCGQLIDALVQLNPEIEAMRAGLNVAVNQDLAKPNRVLKESDEVAVFPPVGGG